MDRERKRENEREDFSKPLLMKGVRCSSRELKKINKWLKW